MSDYITATELRKRAAVYFDASVVPTVYLDRAAAALDAQAVLIATLREIAEEAANQIAKSCASAGCEAEDWCVHAAPFRARLDALTGDAS